MWRKILDLIPQPPLRIVASWTRKPQHIYIHQHVKLGSFLLFFSISSKKTAMYKHSYFDRKTRNCIGYVSGQSLHYTLKASWALDICTKLFCSFKSCNDPLGSKNSRSIFSYTQWEAAVFCVKFCRSHNQHHPMKIPTSKTWTLKDNMKESKDRMRFESWTP